MIGEYEYGELELTRETTVEFRRRLGYYEFRIRPVENPTNVLHALVNVAYEVLGDPEEAWSQVARCQMDDAVKAFEK